MPKEKSHPIWKINLFRQIDKNTAECIDCRANERPKMQFKLSDGNVKSLITHLNSSLHKESDAKKLFDQMTASSQTGKEKSGETSQSGQMDNFVLHSTGSFF